MPFAEKLFFGICVTGLLSSGFCFYLIVRGI